MQMSMPSLRKTTVTLLHLFSMQMQVFVEVGFQKFRGLVANEPPPPRGIHPSFPAAYRLRHTSACPARLLYASAIRERKNPHVGRRPYATEV